MDALLLAILILALFGLLLILFFRAKKKNIITGPIPETFRKILEEHVPFYKNLDDDRKQEFENRIQHFLASTRITGIKTTVEDIDRVLIASSAVIPIFNFSGWEYVNLHEVLLYPDSFDHEFQQEGAHRSISEWWGAAP